MQIDSAKRNLTCNKDKTRQLIYHFYHFTVLSINILVWMVVYTHQIYADCKWICLNYLVTRSFRAICCCFNVRMSSCSGSFRTSEVLEYGRQFAKPAQRHLLILAEQCWEVFLSLIQEQISNKSLPYRGVLEQRRSFPKYILSRCSFSCRFSSMIPFKFKILFWMYFDQIKLVQKRNLCKRKLKIRII